MQQSLNQRPVAAPAVLGVFLIAIGAVILIAREVGVDLFGAIGDWGWPLFIIIPGVALLALALVPTPPRGIGFAIAGGVVTTVGALLLYQSETGNYESWAYAWALIPLAVGAALVLYGLFAHEEGMVRGGVWTSGIAAFVFLAGAWFFEGVFAGRVRPEIADLWPLAFVFVGVALVIRTFFLPGTRRDTPPSPDAS